MSKDKEDTASNLKHGATVANLGMSDISESATKTGSQSTIRRAWQEASVGDVVAGVTVAVTSLPQYIAYAELAGLHGHKGIIASAPPLVVFATITASPCLSLGVTSITAIMANANLRGAEYREAKGDAAWMDLLGAYSLLVGLASILLAFVGAAKLTAYIPKPVKDGWKLGFALAVICSQTAGAVYGAGAKQAKKLCALPLWPGTAEPISGGAAAMYRLMWMLTHPHLWDIATAALSILTIVVVSYGAGILTRMQKWVSRRKDARSMPGLEVILATVFGTLLAAQCSYAGSLVGKPPAPEKGTESEGAGDALGPVGGVLLSWVNGLPWEMPWAELAAQLGGWPKALVSAGAFAAVDFLAIISVQAEAPPAWGWSPARELSGQGIGCIVSGMAGSAPVGGSLSRSMVAKMTGAASPLAGLVCGFATAALAHPVVAGMLSGIPKATLAAIVITAVLPSILRPKDLLRLKGLDAATGWFTALASAFTDPTSGFAMGLAFAAVIAIFRKVFQGGAKVAKND